MGRWKEGKKRKEEWEEKGGAKYVGKGEGRRDGKERKGKKKGGMKRKEEKGVKEIKRGKRGKSRRTAENRNLFYQIFNFGAPIRTLSPKTKPNLACQSWPIVYATMLSCIVIGIYHTLAR